MLPVALISPVTNTPVVATTTTLEVPPIEMFALPPDDPKQRQPNITLAKQNLGWEPKVNLEDGLKDYMNFLGSK